VWIISWLGAHLSGGGIVDVMASRSVDGGLTWAAPVTVAATGVFYDKNWTTCDFSPSRSNVNGQYGAWTRVARAAVLHSATERP
jgi:hypothetical protein